MGSKKRTMTLAFVFVNCAFDQAGAAEKALKEIQGVLEVHTTTGIYDLILKVCNGEQTKSEALGHQEFILTYKSFEPIGPACFPSAA